jgi:hypothetical protein
VQLPKRRLPQKTRAGLPLTKTDPYPTLPLRPVRPSMSPWIPQDAIISSRSLAAARIASSSAFRLRFSHPKVVTPLRCLVSRNSACPVLLVLRKCVPGSVPRLRDDEDVYEIANVAD